MLSEFKLVKLVATASLVAVLLVIALAVSVPKLLILWGALLKSCWIYAGGEKREYASDGDDDAALGKGLFVEAFYKCFFSGDTFYAIKGVNRLM